MNFSNRKKTLKNSFLVFVITLICLFLFFFLIVNTVLIIKSYTNPDKVPSFGGFIPLVVFTDSMAPEINSGDLIILNEVDAEKVKVNDVIAFFDPMSTGTTTVTHRVIEIVEKNDNIYFKTKGDNNNIYDDVLISSDKLIGVYCYKISGFGNVAMFMSTTKGLFLCVILPFVLLVGYDIIIKRRTIKKYNDDKEYLLSEIEKLKSNKNN